MRPKMILCDLIDRQRGHLFAWAPVMLGLGIGIYFAIKTEPSASHFYVILSAILLISCLAMRLSATPRIIAVAVLLILLGFTLAAWRAHGVAAPKLTFRYYWAIEGRIVNVDRSQSDAVRLTLDQVALYNLSPEKVPKKVRVSLHGTQGYFNPAPGQVVALTGHLSPPGGPVEPGGFDFQRQAWFKGLGAVGYTRTPVLIWEPHRSGGLGLEVTRVRLAISLAVQNALPGRAGAFAAAITTGDRSGMSEATLDDLRASNLAHLLAISGLHMGLLTAFVFALIRYGFALIPFVALRWPTKKIGAIGALIAGAAYLAMSGGNVATERAYVMVATMLLAVLADRRAITLRAVALAALIVLTLRPETLLGPGFQMSFAATIALVAVFGWMRDKDWSTSRWPWIFRVVAGVALSSGIAGLATAPIAAAHFNQIPHYGLAANMLSVPLMGAIIIPGAVIAAILWPFGLHMVGLKLMEPAILWILNVADTVAHFPGALSHIWSPSVFVLPMLGLGWLWVVLWQGRSRALGAISIIASLVIWSETPRPDFLVSNTGSLVGLMMEDGRHLSKPRGDSFAALNWLENDGDPVGQSEAFDRAANQSETRFRIYKIGTKTVSHATGKVAGQNAVAQCDQTDIVIVNINIAGNERCTVFDTDALRKTGALAFYNKDGALKVVTARDRQGARLWSQ